MTQTRKQSLTEAVTQFIAGLAVSAAGVAWLLPLVGVHLSGVENLKATLIMATLNIPRQYAVRRAFVIWGRG